MAGWRARDGLCCDDVIWQCIVKKKYIYIYIYMYMIEETRPRKYANPQGLLIPRYDDGKN